MKIDSIHQTCGKTHKIEKQIFYSHFLSRMNLLQKESKADITKQAPNSMLFVKLEAKKKVKNDEQLNIQGVEVGGEGALAQGCRVILDR